MSIGACCYEPIYLQWLGRYRAVGFWVEGGTHMLLSAMTITVTVAKILTRNDNNDKNNYKSTNNNGNDNNNISKNNKINTQYQQL